MKNKQIVFLVVGVILLLVEPAEFLFINAFVIWIMSMLTIKALAFYLIYRGIKSINWNNIEDEDDELV